MAWEAVSKAEVSRLSGVSTDLLYDEWYDWAVGMIERRAGIHNIGTDAEVTITEVKDGNGIGRISVNSPPILSVTSVTVDGYAISSSYYTFDSTSIVFTDSLPTNPHLGSLVFAEGDKNVTIVYESGKASDPAVAFTIALIVKELSRIERSEGAEAYLQIFEVGKNRSTDAPLVEWGIHGKIRGIIESNLGVKFKAA